QTVTAAASVALVAACRAAIERGRIRAMEHEGKGKAQGKDNEVSSSLSQGGSSGKSAPDSASASSAGVDKGKREVRPRPGLLAPPPQLVVAPSWYLARWYMEIAQACPRLRIKVW
ncbi:unnamed protein product, partial [Sphacelaria rigidula]